MKKLFSLIICAALLFSITFSGTAFAATVYETESNDSTGTANTISAGDTVYGKISFDKDNDYYKLRLTAGTSTTFSLSNIPGGCDYDLILYDANGSIIGSSTAFGNTSEKITRTLSAGLYYINVKGYSGTSSSNYTLTVSGSGSTTPTTPPVHGGDAYEFNDTRELASNMGSGSLYLEANIHPLGDVDYYRFSVSSTTTEHIVLYNPAVDLSYHFSVYNSTGGYVCSDGGIGDCTVTLSPGTYYIKVFSYSSESVLNYRLRMTAV
ncbi:hypothetical protein CLHUN_09200 [Ruminiclostridium hungatei]|uniref:Peptidase C-terminal archaeal/bacterial domain-containing protein n=1 Tax=Ruminiclostridium hungatei TaxID=48256 RepID=A0A1V4SNX8_RUMHU|nr:T9SS type A sorting domain-containing protein [Ruminiclostridium hungatei]OPX45544.1 hypothetical protein CLHUN_09200 [Ruminiclostridium hungatei]